MHSRFVVHAALTVFIAIAILGSTGCHRGTQTTPPPAEPSAAPVVDDGAAREALRFADEQRDVDRYVVPVTDAQPSRGPDDALVTLVLFSDFQCPFCARVSPTLDALLREYPGELRVVWRNLPLGFHPNAMPAAEAAMEAFAQGGDERFWRMHDLLFQHQTDLSRERLDGLAAQLGLDMSRYHAAMDQHVHRDAIEDDSRLASTVGANGTPNAFINGVQITGAQPQAAFATLIDSELGIARRFVRAGTPPDQVYAAVTRDGLREAAPPRFRDDPPARRPQPDPAAVYYVPLAGDLPQRGPDDALVTIVQFSDLQCPFCKRVEPTLARLLATYGRDLRIVWMNNPLGFHPNALPAAIALLEAFEQGGDALFWPLQALLFEYQTELTRENIEHFATEVGVDLGQLRAALDQQEHLAVIEEQQGLANGLGATGTPSFFINGRNVRGAVPYESFEAVVNEELARARALVAGGVARAAVYEAAIRGGATSIQFLPVDDAPEAPTEPTP